MFEHLARPVRMDPRCGVVQDACGVAVHVLASSLPRFKLANDLLAVLAVRLQIRGALEEIDRAAQLIYLCSHLERVCERATKGVCVPLRVPMVGEAEPRR